MRDIVIVIVSLAACGRPQPPPPPPPTPPPTWSVRCAAVDPHPAADLHPTFELGDGRAQGDLPAQEVEASLEAAGVELARCDAERRTRLPQLAGTLEARFFITPSGTVTSTTTSVQAGSAGDMQPVATCVDQVIAQQRFPRPHGGGGVLVTYPISFHPPRLRSFASEVRDVGEAVQRALAARLASISACLENASAAVSVDPTGVGSVVFDARDRKHCDLTDLAVAYKPSAHTAVSCTFVATR